MTCRRCRAKRVAGSSTQAMPAVRKLVEAGRPPRLRLGELPRGQPRGSTCYRMRSQGGGLRDRLDATPLATNTLPNGAALREIASAGLTRVPPPPTLWLEWCFPDE